MEPSRFQVVLLADGSVTFNYNHDVFFGDGIVGLFPDEEPSKADLLVSVPYPTDTSLPGHLDLLEVAIYTGNHTDGLIVEWTTRGPVPTPADGTVYTYRLYFDMDAPYWDGSEGPDFGWTIDVRSDEITAWESTVLPSDADNKLLVEAHLPIDFRADAAAFYSVAGEFRDDNWVGGDVTDWTIVEFPQVQGIDIDLSIPQSEFRAPHYEVFHYQSAPDFGEIACRLIDIFGDVFDFMVFNLEFLVDATGGGVRGVYNHGNINVTGTGLSGGRLLPCSRRLKLGYPQGNGNFYVAPSRRSPDWTGFEGAVIVFAHEVSHAWLAYASYERNRERVPLFDNDCGCHWLAGLHTPAAFPWDSTSPGPGGFMNGLVEGTGILGGFWRENGDGTFTPITDLVGGGPSWLDLYMMGVADADEVPDMFILRNLQRVEGGVHRNSYTGDKEIVTIEQIVAAEGPRTPSYAESRKDFNVGFVYLTEAGKRPDDYMLGLHATFIDLVGEHWRHITGERSEVARPVAAIDNTLPVAVSTLPDLTLQAGSAAVVEVSEAFRDPDRDSLSYEATSSAPAVASVAVAGSSVTVKAVAAGTGTVTVAAVDTSGWNAAATVEFRVTVRASSTFSDHPIRLGTTPVRAAHVIELRQRIDALWEVAGLGRFAWTDPVLTVGRTPVKLVHLLELRSALAAAYAAAGRGAPAWTDAAPAAGTTPLRAAHLMELRAAVVALE